MICGVLSARRVAKPWVRETALTVIRADAAQHRNRPFRAMDNSACGRKVMFTNVCLTFGLMPLVGADHMNSLAVVGR